MRTAEPKTATDEAAVDTQLQEVVRRIVNDFNGDIVAYFKAIKGDKKPEENEESQRLVASRFAKYATS